MVNKCFSLDYSLVYSDTCTDCDFVDSSGFVSVVLRPFAVLGWFAVCALWVFCRFVCQNHYQLVTDAVFKNRFRLNAFIFESETLRVFYRFVCQNHYWLVTDAVFKNRLSVCVFADKLWHTSFFLGCMPCMPPMRPILNYHSYSESGFVCHVCQKQIK